MNKPIIAADRLKQLVHYDPDAGKFARLIQRTSAKSTGWPDKAGYLYMMLDGRSYPLHRLAWLYMTGRWPGGDIDHIDGVKTNNRFRNLRDVPTNFNMQNERRARINNRFGLMGVQFRKDRGKYIAVLKVDGSTRRFGAFDTPEEAHAAYLEAKRIHHPGFLC